MKFHRIILIVAVMAVLTAACVPAPSGVTPGFRAPSGPGIGVGITSDTCPDIDLVVGHIVSWTNQDAKVHIIRHKPADGGSQFDSGPLQPEQGFEFKFTVPGEYAYQCTEGDTELGRVTVK